MRRRRWRQLCTVHSLTSLVRPLPLASTPCSFGHEIAELLPSRTDRPNHVLCLLISGAHKLTPTSAHSSTLRTVCRQQRGIRTHGHSRLGERRLADLFTLAHSHARGLSPVTHNTGVETLNLRPPSASTSDHACAHCHSPRPRPPRRMIGSRLDCDAVVVGEGPQHPLPTAALLVPKSRSNTANNCVHSRQGER